MRCKRCDYPLWNLRSRNCPECGAAFQPSEFEFVPNSVRFCCPGCGQEYYGTSPKGHLEPEAFRCVRCGQQVRMDDMVLLPAEGVEEARTRVETVPWLDRSRRGFFKGWLGTIGMSLAMPGRLAKAIPGNVGVLSALWFALLTGTLYGVLGCGLILLPMLLIGGPGAAGTLVGAAILVLAIPIGLAATLGIWALMTHGVLRLTGETAGGLGRTTACLCYASGANVLLAIPCVGPYLLTVSWVWWTVAAAVMLHLAQRVSGLRAAVAAGLPPLLATLALAGWIALVVAPGVRASAAAAGPALAAARAPAAAARVAAALRSYAAAHSGAAPPHGLALLTDQHVYLPDLFLNGGPSNAAEATVAGINLNTVQFLSVSERAAAVAVAARSLGTGTPAHRIGDMVFVYGGIDLSPNSTADPGLWLVVCAPLASQPAAAVAPRNTPFGAIPTPMISVCSLDGQVTSFPRTSLPAFLAEQNELRAAAGLPPLPDPLTVGAPTPP